ncbi:DUF2970 domain-containing protein [Glaciecola sp. 1036]|uniref:DUF2970 domain-containing protein n=1 Tax=Alteromonadaceae TaxID=72275 RepID=UPI003D0776E9
MLKRILSVLQSVLAAFFGVQSQAKYNQDFTQNDSILPFIIMGILVFAVFIGVVLVFVNIML